MQVHILYFLKTILLKFLKVIYNPFIIFFIIINQKKLNCDSITMIKSFFRTI